MASGGASERLAFILQLDADGAIREFKNVGNTAERELRRADNSLDRVGGRMQSAGLGAMAFAGVAGTALMSFARSSEEAAAEHRKLDHALATAPQLAGASRDSFLALADSIQDTTVAEGDAVVGLMGLLGTLGMTQDQITELTPLVVDFATRYGLGFDQAARLVNGALDGNAGRLERYIGQIGESESVTDALARTVGGFAEGEAQSLSGQLTILKNNLGDVAEGIGVGVVGAVNDAMGPVKGLADAFNETSPATQETVGRLATFGVAAIGAAGAASFLIGSAIKMRTNFRQAADALRNTTVRAGGAGAAIGKLSVYTAAAATVFAAYQGEQEKAAATARKVEAATIEASASIRRHGSELEGLTRWLQEVIPQNGLLAESMAAAGVSAEEVAGAFGESEEAAVAMAGRLAEAQGATRAEAMELVQLAAAGYQAEQRSRDVTAATGERTDAQGEAIDVTGEETGATGGLNVALEELREKNEEARDATLARAEAQLGLIGTDIALREAERATTEAIQAFTVATDDASTVTDEVAAAQDAAAQAALREAEGAARVAEQLAGATGQSWQQADSARVMADRLQGVANTLAPGSPLRVQLEGYIAQLHSVPRTIHTTFEQTYRVTNASGDNSIGVRAEGGPVKAGEPYIVGEEGPELMVPSASGTIIPNDALTGGGGGGGGIGGGNTYQISVQALDGKSAADAVMDAIHQYERRNGNSWRAA